MTRLQAATCGVNRVDHTLSSIGRLTTDSRRRSRVSLLLQTQRKSLSIGE
jgi:hypothetical protein